MIDAYIGLGSNMNDRLGNLSRALDAIAALPATQLLAVSHAYESEPWGVEDQAPFLNAVAHVATGLQADQLLALLKDAEVELGRLPGVRYGPRVIDLDLLLYGDEEWDSPDITIPHRRMAEREFVVRPLLEVDPEVRWPNGDYVTEEGVRVGRIIGDAGPVPGWESITAPRERGRTGTPERAKADLVPGDLPARGGSADYRVPGSDRIETPWGDDWVAVGVARMDPSPSIAELIFYEAVLKDAGIPCEFYPGRPGEDSYNPYRVPRYVDLYVPESRLREARELIREAQQAPPAGEGT